MTTYKQVKERNDVFLTTFNESDAADKIAMQDDIVKQNMGYVQFLANEFVSEFPCFKYLYDDLVAEGYLALVRVARCLSCTVVRCLTSFLAMNVYEAFSTCIDNDALIRVPHTTFHHRKRMGKPLVPPDIKPLSAIKQDDLICKPDTVYELKEEMIEACSSDQEIEILKLREQGYKDDAIATVLGVSARTVFMLRRDVYRRLADRNPEISA